MTEQADPWWPLKWRKPKNEGGDSLSTDYPDALVELPGYREPVHVMDYMKNGNIKDYTIYVSEKSSIQLGIATDLLGLRAALITLSQEVTTS